MGFIAEMTTEHGDYSVEIRHESFYLYGSDSSEIFVYPHADKGTGTVEMLTKDIDKIRACLDLVEFHDQGERGKYRYENIVSHFEITLDHKTEAVVRTQTEALVICKALEDQGLAPSIKPVMLSRTQKVVNALAKSQAKQEQNKQLQDEMNFSKVLQAFVGDQEITVKNQEGVFTGIVSSVDKTDKSFVLGKSAFYIQDVEVS